MDTTIKFRTSTEQKEALERAADHFGWSVSALLRRAAHMAQRGLVTSDSALADFRQMREFANAAMAALEACGKTDAIDKAREVLISTEN